ncbi:myb-related protein 308-like [Zingiber officinale]|uniref:Uncharacterized protein n=1 Tax=Zingiber officinale TaxID=94328 RepID=A0A8J5EW91_ZINOF|nr:myb-related protein 308-like [Zingiber officinale]KAG6475429.1 hypothetical protein ZIOFF_064649 [Zingiber officinale]
MLAQYKGRRSSSMCPSTMGRSPCCEKAHTNRGAWTKEEDQLLIAYIKAHGEGCWRSLPKAAGLQRCGKSCRLRWINYLRPDLKRGNFTGEEDELIIKLHRMIGNKWSVIAGRLPGRTDNEIKNYWNTHIKRKLIARGIDPKTHLPIDGCSDHSALSSDRQTVSVAAAPQSEETLQPSVENRLQTICFCYRLGFQGSEACSCHKSYTKSFVSFQYPPLEEGQQA